MAAATEPALVDRVTPTATSLQRVTPLLAPTGSGSTVTVTVKFAPRHPAPLTGVTVYTTFTGLRPVFVQASSANSLASLPAPALTVPALCVKPLALVAIL